MTHQELMLLKNFAQKHSPDRMRKAIRLYIAEQNLLEAVKRAT